MRKAFIPSPLTTPLVRTLAVAALAVVCAVFNVSQAAPTEPAAPQRPVQPVRWGLLLADAVPLRSAPSEAAAVHAQLWRGEWVELRSQQRGHVQVWHHGRERGGHVAEEHVWPLPVGDGAAAQLWAQVQLVRTQTGAESLGLGLAAAYVQAATPQRLASAEGADVLAAWGHMAERLAERANQTGASRQAQSTTAAHLEAAGRFGVAFKTLQTEARSWLCYEGDAHRRVLALPATPAQRARAALALTRPDCMAPNLHPQAQEQQERWREQVLAQVPEAALDAGMAASLRLRRADVRASLAWATLRRAEPALALATDNTQAALDDLARVPKTELADAQRAAYQEATLRLNAIRWAQQASLRERSLSHSLHLSLSATTQGEQCLELRTQVSGAAVQRRCTFGQVWLASASANREGNALALNVQTLDGWAELWVWRREAGNWLVQVLPPASEGPGLGYAELAGWVPGGQEMLVVREARIQTAAAGTQGAASTARFSRRFEVLRIDTLATQRWASEPDQLGAFGRWQSAAWKAGSLSLR